MLNAVQSLFANKPYCQGEIKGSNPRLLLDKIYLRSTQNSYGKSPKGWIIDVDPVFT